MADLNNPPSVTPSYPQPQEQGLWDTLKRAWSQW